MITLIVLAETSMQMYFKGTLGKWTMTHTRLVS